MFKIIEDNINSFLNLIEGISESDIQAIKDKYTISITDDMSKGHITSNICLILGSIHKANPKELSKDLCAQLNKLKKFEKVESAGPGFINIFLKRKDFASIINKANKKTFGESDVGKKEKIQIEFVSANPTGPLHVGHGRGAAFGDALARIFSATGYEVQKEYYVNDAGRQIDILSASVLLRLYEEELESFFPEVAYKGKYINVLANEFLKNNKKQNIEIKEILKNLPSDNEDQIDAIITIFKKNHLDLWEEVKSYSLDKVLDEIKSDLSKFNVNFDNWFFESDLGNIMDSNSEISNAIKKLQSNSLIYKENGATWLNTSASNDDKNRVLIRDDNRATYFASDVAYHKNKLDRGFSKIVNIWGADHHGYIKRIESSIIGLGYKKEQMSVQLVQFANLFKEGKKIKMSTRSGEFYTLSNLIDEIGKDASRFYYLSKQADQHLDFDLDLAKTDSKENIFYYIQYAHARISSLQIKSKLKDKDFDLIKLQDGSYNFCDQLIHEIYKYPSVVLRASNKMQPHLIIFYLKDVAHKFHSYYNDNKILSENEDNLKSIMFCLSAVKNVLSSGLNLLGIEPMNKM